MPQTLWCSDVAHVTFEVAEACVSHRIGSAVAGPMPVRRQRYEAIASSVMPRSRKHQPDATVEGGSQAFRLKPLHKVRQVGVIDFLRRLDPGDLALVESAPLNVSRAQ
jgi:hypothetical protein